MHFNRKTRARKYMAHKMFSSPSSIVRDDFNLCERDDRMTERYPAVFAAGSSFFQRNGHPVKFFLQEYACKKYNFLPNSNQKGNRNMQPERTIYSICFDSDIHNIELKFFFLTLVFAQTII
jgi:hypothetical protein